MALGEPPAGLVFQKSSNPVIVICGAEDHCCVALASTKDHEVCTGIQSPKRLLRIPENSYLTFSGREPYHPVEPA
jgi:hypothetical protein